MPDRLEAEPRARSSVPQESPERVAVPAVLGGLAKALGQVLVLVAMLWTLVLGGLSLLAGHPLMAAGVLTIYALPAAAGGALLLALGRHLRR